MAFVCLFTLSYSHLFIHTFVSWETEILTKMWGKFGVLSPFQTVSETLSEELAFGFSPSSDRGDEKVFPTGWVGCMHPLQTKGTGASPRRLGLPRDS